MLASLYYKSLNKVENLDEKNLVSDIRKFVVTFILLVILDLILMIYAIYCIFKCPLISMILKIVLLLLLFVPGIGFIVSVAVIIYFYVTCKNSLKYNFF